MVNDRIRRGLSIGHAFDSEMKKAVGLGGVEDKVVVVEVDRYVRPF
jgi:hypothetical protein